MALFNQQPKLSAEAFLTKLAARMYRSARARKEAIAGWKAFDEGFGKLPIGLGDTGNPQYSGRFGFAWSMCIATPMLEHLFGDERRHEIHWLSPYNFLTRTLATRLEFHFWQILARWSRAAKHFAAADRLEGHTAFSTREAISAQAHLLSVRSASHWCLGAHRLRGSGAECLPRFDAG